MGRGKERKKRLKEFALKLESNLPKSERWFRKLWETNNFRDAYDRYNHPWCRRIPDLVNHKYRYIIEIDGSYHDLESQKTIDAKKDRFFRIKAYNIQMFFQTAECVVKYRRGGSP
jgi:very-short-patch-repair endonuclease